MSASLRLGDVAPDFTAESSVGKINFYEYQGSSWVVLFSHPGDFTPVCTTELGTVAKLLPEFNKRNTKVIGLSIDPVSKHVEWIKDINETQNCTVTYPVIADDDKTVSLLYGMLSPNSAPTYDKMTVRSVFIIDPNHKVRLIFTYPAATGRNFDEILRVLDALQLTDSHRVATPANWKPGDDVVILPAVTNEEATKLFPKGFDTKKPYLRFTPQPNLNN